MPQHGSQIISCKNPEDYFCDCKVATVQTDSSMSPARKWPYMDLLLVAGCLDRLWFKGNIYAISTASFYLEEKLDYCIQSYELSSCFSVALSSFSASDIKDKLFLIFLHISRTRFMSSLVSLCIWISTSYCQLISRTKNLVAPISFCVLVYSSLEILPVTAAHSYSSPQKPLVKTLGFYLKETK